jgi:hypothetical protein
MPELLLEDVLELDALVDDAVVDELDDEAVEDDAPELDDVVAPPVPDELDDVVVPPVPDELDDAAPPVPDELDDAAPPVPDELDDAVPPVPPVPDELEAPDVDELVDAVPAPVPTGEPELPHAARPMSAALLPNIATTNQVCLIRTSPLVRIGGPYKGSSAAGRGSDASLPRARVSWSAQPASRPRSTQNAATRNTTTAVQPTASLKWLLPPRTSSMVGSRSTGRPSASRRSGLASGMSVMVALPCTLAAPPQRRV